MRAAIAFTMVALLGGQAQADAVDLSPLLVRAAGLGKEAEVVYGSSPDTSLVAVRP